MHSVYNCVCVVFVVCILLSVVQELPLLWKTARAVYGQVVTQGTYKDHIFMNFAASYRGSMRKAPSVILWVIVLREMARTGDRLLFVFTIRQTDLPLN